MFYKIVKSKRYYCLFTLVQSKAMYFSLSYFKKRVFSILDILYFHVSF